MPGQLGSGWQKSGPPVLRGGQCPGSWAPGGRSWGHQWNGAHRKTVSPFWCRSCPSGKCFWACPEFQFFTYLSHFRVQEIEAGSGNVSLRRSGERMEGFRERGGLNVVVVQRHMTVPNTRHFFCSLKYCLLGPSWAAVEIRAAVSTQ